MTIPTPSPRVRAFFCCPLPVFFSLLFSPKPAQVSRFPLPFYSFALPFLVANLPCFLPSQKIMAAILFSFFSIFAFASQIPRCSLRSSAANFLFFSLSSKPPAFHLLPFLLPSFPLFFSLSPKPRLFLYSVFVAFAEAFSTAPHSFGVRLGRNS